MRRFSLAILFVLLFGAVTFIPMAQSATPVECGNVVEDSFSTDTEGKFYAIDLSPGDQIDISAVPLGDNLNLTIGLFAPDGSFIVGGGNITGAIIRPNANPTLSGGMVSAEGTYTIVAYNNNLNRQGILSVALLNGTSGGVGVYNLFISCIKRDGTVIEAGGSDSTSTDTASLTPATCAGLCFPGLLSIDFSAGLYIPIVAGQPQTAALGGNLVILYTYDGTANQTATLSLVRVSDDISVGVAVIKRDTNEIVFIGGMPSSNYLLTELVFPSDGTYVIGLFQMVTTEKVDTSGVVQVSLE